MLVLTLSLLIAVSRTKTLKIFEDVKRGKIASVIKVPSKFSPYSLFGKLSKYEAKASVICVS